MKKIKTIILLFIAFFVSGCSCTYNTEKHTLIVTDIKYKPNISKTQCHYTVTCTNTDFFIHTIELWTDVGKYNVGDTLYITK